MGVLLQSEGAILYVPHHYIGTVEVRQGAERARKTPPSCPAPADGHPPSFRKIGLSSLLRLAAAARRTRAVAMIAPIKPMCPRIPLRAPIYVELASS